MNAPLKPPRNQHVVAALASGVVLSLTALTAGVAPAIADPGSGPGGRDPVAPITPTTAVLPVPVDIPTAKPTVAEAPAPAIVPVVPPVAPVVPAAPPVVPAVAPVIPAAPPSTEVPVPVPVNVPPATVAPVPQTPTVKPQPTPTEPSVAPSVAVVPPAAIVDPPVANTPQPAPRTVPAPVVDKAPATAAAPSPEVPVVADVPAAPSINALPSSPPLVAPTSPPSSSVAPEPELRSQGAGPATGPQPTSSAAPSTQQDVVTAASIQTVKPQPLEAPQADVMVAKTSKPLEEKPNPAPESDVVALRRSVELRNQTQGTDGGEFRGVADQPRRAERDWDRNVKQWDRNWVQYDQYYRPVILNPFRAPLRIAYMYLNAPRILIIPALASAVIELAQFAAYSFTAVVDTAAYLVNTAVNTAANLVNTAVDVAVGTFFGGGYYPRAGLPAPLPPPLLRYDNVPVQVRYGQDTYRPFRVQQIVDVGDDAVYGERKVLLDGMTPVWGRWTQAPGGERQFEVHKTQQYPGLDEPSQGRLPGNYQLSLASDESSAGLSRRDVYLVVAAATMATLSLGAVLLSMAIGRRRREF